MPRPSLNETAMTGAERQARYRATRAAGSPVAGVLRPVEYAAWLEALPNNQQEGAVAEAVRAIVDLDLFELQATGPPRGFGRD